MLGMECAGEASAAVGHRRMFTLQKPPISNSFPTEAKGFVSLEMRFLFLLYHPVKTPMRANRVMVWGSNEQYSS